MPADGTNNASPGKSGGLYKNVRISVRTVNIIILAGIALLIAVTVFLVAHGGFTVRFDTDGGSAVASQTRMYGELVEEPEAPVKEGFRFVGWALDTEGKLPWNMAADTVTESMTLFAVWEADG